MYHLEESNHVLNMKFRTGFVMYIFIIESRIEINVITDSSIILHVFMTGSINITSDLRC